VRLRITRHLDNFQSSELTVRAILPCPRLGIGGQTKMVDQEIRSAEVKTGLLNSGADTFVHAPDEENSRIAAK